MRKASRNVGAPWGTDEFLEVHVVRRHGHRIGSRSRGTAARVASATQVAIAAAAQRRQAAGAATAMLTAKNRHWPPATTCYRLHRSSAIGRIPLTLPPGAVTAQGRGRSSPQCSPPPSVLFAEVAATPSRNSMGLMGACAGTAGQIAIPRCAALQAYIPGLDGGLPRESSTSLAHDFESITRSQSRSREASRAQWNGSYGQIPRPDSGACCHGLTAFGPIKGRSRMA